MTLTRPARSAQTLKQRALDAAEQLVVECGASSLTLEAVAQAAGASKGGLLYHFPTKEALLQGMIERHLKDFESHLAATGTEPNVSSNATLAARVLALLQMHHPGKQTIAASLLAASAANPQLMATCREHYARLIEAVEKLPCGFEQATLVLLAVDGLLLGETMRLSPFTAEQRERVVAALIARARECDTVEPR